MAAASQKAATALQVAAWRKRRGFTVEEAAADCGVAPRTFYRWVSGESESPRWLGDKFRTEGVR